MFGRARRTVIQRIPAADTAPPNDPIPGLQPTWMTNSSGAPRAPVNRAPDEGFLLEVEGFVDFPTLHGRRFPSPAFAAAGPWRYPPLNVGRTDRFDWSTEGNGWVNGVLGLDVVGGYRLGGGLGEILLGFRGLSGDGQRYLANGDWRSDTYLNALGRFGGMIGDVPVTGASILATESGWADPLGAAIVATSLRAYSLDVAYGNGLYTLPVVDLSWTAGGRLGQMDEHDVMRSRGLETRVDTRFVGAGPAGSLTAEWRLFEPADQDHGVLAVITRVNGALLAGHVRQIDREGVFDPYPPAYRYGTGQEARTIPNFGFDLALAVRGYSPRVGLTIGYRFETWKGVGRVGNSSWDLVLHEVYLGLRTNY